MGRSPCEDCKHFSVSAIPPKTVWCSLSLDRSIRREEVCEDFESKERKENNE